MYCQLESLSADADKNAEVGADEDVEMSELRIHPMDPSTGKPHVLRYYQSYRLN